VLGFRTGYNSAAEGVVDIFEPLGKDAGQQALYVIESWCSKNPAGKFDEALFDLVVSMRKTKRIE
jgi:hypothetical protein